MEKTNEKKSIKERIQDYCAGIRSGGNEAIQKAEGLNKLSEAQTRTSVPGVGAHGFPFKKISHRR